MNLGVRLVGIEKITGKLKKIAAKYPEKVEKAFYRITSSAADEARRACPIDTGRLKSSIDNKVWRRTGEVIGLVFTNVYYGIFVHFGTSKMRARPFMNKAINYISSKAVPILQKYLKA